MVGLEQVEQLHRRVGHASGVVRIGVILLGQRHGRVNYARRKRLVLLAGNVAGQIEQQAVAHRDVRYDYLLGLGLVQQNLIDQQRGIERLGLGERQPVPPGQLLGRIADATRDELVECPGVDHRQLARVARFGAGLSRGEPGVASHAHNRVDFAQSHHAAQNRQRVRDVLAEQFGRAARRLLADRQGLLHANRTEP